jgi:segregation and condensation protein A
MDATERCVPRRCGPDERFADLIPDLLANVNPLMLRDAMQTVLTPKPQTRLLLDHVAPIRASVKDALVELVDELPRAGRISFSRLTAGLVERLEVIVRFLALLELYKQGAVDLEQATTFGELQVRWLGGDFEGAAVEEYQG